MIRVGILGTARIAGAFFRHPLYGVTIASVASRDPARGEAFARNHGIPHVASSYDALLGDRSLDAVYIPLPQHLHAEYARRAAESGKHVLVEKPAALSSKDLLPVLEACRTRGVLFMEAFMYRFLRVHNRARELVQDGTIGPLRHIDFHLNVNARVLNLGGTRFARALGGGALYDRGIYAADFLRFITGAEPRLVSSHLRRDPESGVDVLTKALFETGEITASVTVGFLFDANFYTLAGETGSIHNPVAVSGRYDPQSLSIHLHDNNRRFEEAFPAGMPYKWELEYFARCIERGEEPFLGGANSLGNLRVLDDLLGRSVEW